jgi:hypothetical protein
VACGVSVHQSVLTASTGSVRRLPGSCAEHQLAQHANECPSADNDTRRSWSSSYRRVGRPGPGARVAGAGPCSTWIIDGARDGFDARVCSRRNNS